MTCHHPEPITAQGQQLLTGQPERALPSSLSVRTWGNRYKEREREGGGEGPRSWAE
jgi:hypothetical protein